LEKIDAKTKACQEELRKDLKAKETQAAANQKTLEAHKKRMKHC
jgi:hypothetical protein